MGDSRSAARGLRQWVPPTLVGVSVVLVFIWGVGVGARGWFPMSALQVAYRSLVKDTAQAFPQSEFSLSRSEFNHGADLVFHIRHAKRSESTDIWGFDAMGRDPAVTSGTIDQWVCLNSEGIAQAELTAWVFYELAIDVDRVYSSPSCRSRQHAEISNLGPITIAQTLLYAEVFPISERPQFEMNQGAFLTELIATTGTVVLFGHGIKAFDSQDVVELNSGAHRDQGGVTVFKRDVLGQRLVELATFPTMSDFYRALG